MAELNQELASRWQRLWGALIDALIVLAIIYPAMWFFGVLQQLYRGEAMSLEQRIVWFVSGTVVFIVLQGHLLGKYGQTIGKRMVGTRIVSCEDGRILPFWTVFPLRYLSISLVSQIPVAGQWLTLIDVFFIFRKDKRCIHDLIAGTKVVKAGKQNSDSIAPSSKPAVIAGSMETPTPQEKEHSTTMNDDAFYDEVAKEIQENRMVPGVWARAFAEADGDENRAKAIYIKRRVAELTESAVQKRTEANKNEPPELLKCAATGDVATQHKLAVCYEFGKGVKKDAKKALVWYLRAAEQGHAESQFRMGQYFVEGSLVFKNHKAAVAWYARAAEQGHAFARKELEAWRAGSVR